MVVVVQSGVVFGHVTWWWWWMLMAEVGLQELDDGDPQWLDSKTVQYTKISPKW